MGLPLPAPLAEAATAAVAAMDAKRRASTGSPDLKREVELDVYELSEDEDDEDASGGGEVDEDEMEEDGEEEAEEEEDEEEEEEDEFKAEEYTLYLGFTSEWWARGDSSSRGGGSGSNDASTATSLPVAAVGN